MRIACDPMVAAWREGSERDGGRGTAPVCAPAQRTVQRFSPDGAQQSHTQQGDAQSMEPCGHAECRR